MAKAKKSTTKSIPWFNGIYTPSMMQDEDDDDIPSPQSSSSIKSIVECVAEVVKGTEASLVTGLFKSQAVWVWISPELTMLLYRNSEGTRQIVFENVEFVKAGEKDVSIICGDKSEKSTVRFPARAVTETWFSAISALVRCNAKVGAQPQPCSSPKRQPFDHNEENTTAEHALCLFAVVV